MSFEDTLTPVQLVEFNELDCKRYAARRKELAAMRKMEGENKPDFAKILKTAMEALGAAVVVFIVLAIMFVASVAGKTNETREIGGHAYDWGNTVVTDDGNAWSAIDAPECAEGQRVTVVFKTMGTKEVEDDEIIDIY